jgi:preprotein translocase subunit SecE
MTVEEDAKRERAAEGAPDEEGQAGPSASDAAEAVRADASEARRDAAEVRGESSAIVRDGAPEPSDASASAPPDEDHDVSPVAPTQLGARRFVYAAYFAAAIGIAFISSKALDLAWTKLQNYQPSIGEPRDEIVMPLAGAIGAGAALYYWYRTRARQLAEEVAAEMSKVTWPSRTEVTNGTVVVIVTTLVSTVFFALMDKFWGFVTNLVYGGT